MSLAVIGYRVKIVIPQRELWFHNERRPGYVLNSMIGTEVDYVITHIDRENGWCVGSRKLAMLIRRKQTRKILRQSENWSHTGLLHRDGTLFWWPTEDMIFCCLEENLDCLCTYSESQYDEILILEIRWLLWLPDTIMSKSRSTEKLSRSGKVIFIENANSVIFLFEL